MLHSFLNVGGRRGLLDLAAAASSLATSCFSSPHLRRRAPNCYELIGCAYKDYFKSSDLKQLSCQILWEVRNTIYKENGYCFHTQKAIQAFGNAGCKYDKMGDVPLNSAECHNVLAIKKVEAKKGC